MKNMKNYTQYLNGKFVEESNFLISPRDLGFTRGYGVFEYIRTYNGKPFKISEHINRLLHSAELIKLKHDFSYEKIEWIILELLKLNNDSQEKSIRVHLSGGVSNSMHQINEATILVFMDPFKPKDSGIYKNGVILNTVKYERDVPRSKNVNYIEGVIQTQVNREKGFFEPLYYSDDQVFETSNSNIFVVKNEIIYTPKNKVFLGTARGVVVNDLKSFFDIREQDIKLDFLLDADEVFLASGGKQIAPVVMVDSYKISDGKVGPVTLNVLEKYREFVLSDRWW